MTYHRILQAFAAFLFVHMAAPAGLSAQPYWQQRVEYDMDVRYNTAQKMLDGHQRVKYTNHSPDTLHFIIFHVWNNAYSSRQTPFARQRLNSGSADFEFAPKSHRGRTDSLLFFQDDRPLYVEPLDNHSEMVRVHLPQPLLPGQSVEVRVKFQTFLPRLFSRGGYYGHIVQAAQWYPKPAVYDKNGWHPMPYLDQGEFYSEFGKFTVRLTVPDNFWVASTGRLTTESEREKVHAYAKSLGSSLSFMGSDTLDMDEWEDEVPPPPPMPRPKPALHISPNFKTLTYEQDSIHDFAFCMSPLFQVLHRRMERPGGTDSIDLYAFADTALYVKWHRYNVLDMMERTVRAYSEWVGPYPYSQMTVASGALAPNAGGMEYPMIAIIGKGNLEDVVIHEAGHNWFYGILASNERQYPWMDEGLNSWMEEMVTARLWDLPDSAARIKMNRAALLKGGILNEGWMYNIAAIYRLDQAADMHSTHFQHINYGGIIYIKTKRALMQLYTQLGQDTMKMIFNEYYRRWAFKHPQPEDFFAIVREIGGPRTEWFINEAIGSTKRFDYALKGGRNNQLSIRNKGQFAAPVDVLALDSFHKDQSRLFNKKRFTDTVIVARATVESDTVLAGIKGQMAALASSERTLDYNPGNNATELPGFRADKPNWLRMFPFPVFHYRQRSVYALPALGWNRQDGLMPTLVLFNNFLEKRAVYWQLAPSYGFGSGQLAGMGQVYAHLRPYSESHIHSLQVGLNGRRYSVVRNELTYNRATAFAEYILMNRRVSKPWMHTFTLNHHLVDLEAPGFHADSTARLDTRNLVYQLAAPLGTSHQIAELAYSILKGNTVEHSVLNAHVFHSGNSQRLLGMGGIRRRGLLRQVVELRVLGIANVQPGGNGFGAVSMSANTAWNDPTYQTTMLNRGGLRSGHDPHTLLHLPMGWVPPASQNAVGVNFSHSVLGSKDRSTHVFLYGEGAAADHFGHVYWASGAGVSFFWGAATLWYPLVYSDNIRRQRYANQALVPLIFSTNLSFLQVRRVMYRIYAGT